VGCFDIYKHDVDCQWIDLTDVKPGVYTFRVTVNPDTKVAEMRYDNNVVLCKLYYYDSTAYFDECKLSGSSSIAVGLGRAEG
jgi:lysyl oxidase-like protein 2/3/4